MLAGLSRTKKVGGLVAIVMVLLVIAAVIRESSANEGFDSIGNTEAAVDDSFTQFDEFGDGEAIGDFADERSFATEEQALAADAAEADIDSESDGAATERALRQTGDLFIQVDELSTSIDEVRAIAEANGGFVANENTALVSTGESTIAIRVEAQNFDKAIAELQKLGRVQSISQNVDDVTLEVVDLQARVDTQSASVERLQQLIAGASNLNEIVELENQLVQRESTLASLQGQLETLSGQVSFSTISVTLFGESSAPRLEVSQTVYADHDGGDSCGSSETGFLSEGQDATLCYEIINTGTTSLGSLSLVDESLEFDVTDLIVVDGSLDQPLAAGQAVVVAYEFDADRTLRTRTEVTAVAVDADGEDLGTEVEQTTNRSIQVERNQNIDGFTDGIEWSWNFVKTIGSLLVLVAGLLIPLLILAPIVWFARRTWKARVAKA